MIEAVAGIIYNEQQEILIAQRPPKAILGGLWEFPGGKLEPGETPLHALIRELEEEIDIHVIEAKPFHQISHTYPNNRAVLLHVWEVIKFNGIPIGKEGQVVRWIKTSLLNTLSFPEGNKTIIEMLG